MNKPILLYHTVVLSSITFILCAIAQESETVEPSNTATSAEMMEQKAVQIVSSISSGNTGAALDGLQDLAREPDGLVSLRGKAVLTRLCDTLAVSTNETETVYLGAVLIQAGDPNVDEQMNRLANSEDVIKKTVAAHYLLQNARKAQDTIHAYDILAQVACTITQISQADLTQERLTHITNIARDTIKKFERLCSEADLAPLQESLDSTELRNLPPYEAKLKQLELIEPWWQMHRLKILESIQAQQ